MHKLFLFFKGLVFKTFETLATFDPDLMAGLIPAGKQAVIQLEQKRGVGTDMQLRWVLFVVSGLRCSSMSV